MDLITRQKDIQIWLNSAVASIFLGKDLPVKEQWANASFYVPTEFEETLDRRNSPEASLVASLKHLGWCVEEFIPWMPYQGKSDPFTEEEVRALFGIKSDASVSEFTEAFSRMTLIIKNFVNALDLELVSQREKDTMLRWVSTAHKRTVSVLSMQNTDDKEFAQSLRQTALKDYRGRLKRYKERGVQVDHADFQFLESITRYLEVEVEVGAEVSDFDRSNAFMGIDWAKLHSLCIQHSLIGEISFDEFYRVVVNPNSSTKKVKWTGDLSQLAILAKHLIGLKLVRHFKFVSDRFVRSDGSAIKSSSLNDLYKKNAKKKDFEHTDGPMLTPSEPEHLILYLIQEVISGD